jgi:hypothetical protein
MALSVGETGSVDTGLVVATGGPDLSGAFGGGVPALPGLVPGSAQAETSRTRAQTRGISELTVSPSG